MPARILVLVLLAAPVANAQPVSPWEVGAAAGFASTGDIKGPTGGVSVTRSVNNWLAVGGTFDAARLSASGQTPVMPFVLGGPYSYAIASTFVGAMTQFRLEFGRFVASADLSAGWNEVRTLYSYNTQCGYGSGFNLRLGSGLAFAASSHVLLGLRAALRPPAYSGYCLLMAGPWAFDFNLMYSLTPTASVRF